jgi:hypothetical protein
MIMVTEGIEIGAGKAVDAMASPMDGMARIRLGRRKKA